MAAVVLRLRLVMLRLLRRVMLRLLRLVLCLRLVALRLRLRLVVRLLLLLLVTVRRLSVMARHQYNHPSRLTALVCRPSRPPLINRLIWLRRPSRLIRPSRASRLIRPNSPTTVTRCRLRAACR